MTTPISLRQRRSHVTRYRNLVLKHWVYPKGIVNTERGIRVHAFIGDCIASGGAVTMRTWYEDDNRTLRADVTLIWGDRADANHE